MDKLGPNNEVNYFFRLNIEYGDDLIRRGKEFGAFGLN